MSFFKKRKREPYGLLLDQAGKALEGLAAFDRYAHEPDAAEDLRVRGPREDAGRLREALIEALDGSPATPIDRGNVSSLSHAIDDMIDYACVACGEMVRFEVPSDARLRDMVRALHETGREIASAVRAMKRDPRRAEEHAVRAKKTASYAGRAHREALGELLKRGGAVTVMKTREVYRHVAEAADRGHEAADLIGDILVKLESKKQRRGGRKSAGSLLLLLSLLLAAGTAAAENIALTVFHTNDVHGWIMARDDWRSGKRLGGMPAVASFVEKHRKTGAPTLLLDAGDFFQGTPEGTLTRGRAVADVFNALRYDAVAAGNHEFDYGQDAVRHLAGMLDAPFLGANVESLKTGERVDYLGDSVLKEVGGVKVGIFGLLTAEMPRLQFEKHIIGLRFVDEVETARRMTAALRGRGAEVVIALMHVGYRGKGEDKPYTCAQDIAAAVPGIDLIVSGHSHTSLWKPKRHPKNGTLVVQAGGYLKRMGRVVLEIDPETRKVVSAEGKLIRLYADKLGEDEEILGIVKKYQGEIGRQLDVVIATATAALTRTRKGESTLGSWLTDCTRKWSKVDMCFQNAGGIRADLAEGPLTLRNMFEVMPFDNYIVTLYMKGGSVRRLLDHGVTKAPGAVQVSGVRFRVDRDAPEGERVADVRVGDRPLRDDEVYSVCAPDFIVQGGDDYGAFREGTDKAVTETLIRDTLIWCARRYTPFGVPEMDRIVQR